MYSVTRLYALNLNGDPVLTVRSTCAYSWLPVRPRLSRRWLNALVNRVLQQRLHART